MAYWLDDGFDTWPEVIRAGKAAAGLYVCCGAWIARNLTDGFVPSEVAAMYGTPEWVAKLLSVGLWESEEAGYRDVRYFGMNNPTAEVVKQRREQAAERQRKFRTRDKPRDTRVSNGSSNGVSHRTPTLPPLKGEGARAAARAHPFVEGSDGWCKTCELPRINKVHMNGRAA